MPSSGLEERSAVIVVVNPMFPLSASCMSMAFKELVGLNSVTAFVFIWYLCVRDMENGRKRMGYVFYSFLFVILHTQYRLQREETKGDNTQFFWYIYLYILSSHYTYTRPENEEKRKEVT